ncbi:MAG: hypothetical protein WCK63_11630 [Betaproteobacteria bacterium]
MTDSPATLPPRREGEEHPAASPPRGSRRRRAFVAEAERFTDTTERTAAPAPSLLPAAEDVDLPVLTEVVSPEAAMSEDKTVHLDETQISLLASVITHTIEQQLAHDLPALIESALHHADDTLRAGIATSLENALHEVLSRYK